MRVRAKGTSCDARDRNDHGSESTSGAREPIGCRIASGLNEELVLGENETDLGRTGVYGAM